MTLTPEGGAAIPVSVTTTRKVQGGAAIPVYGYMTAPTDGRPALGGAAIPVRVLTAADLKENGGQWTLEGRPHAMPVYTAPVGATVQGGPAIAVYPVNAWPTVPVVPVALPVPKQVAGLALWLKADAGLYKDAAKAQPVTADADAVYTWADQSGNGRDAVQATAGNRPLYKVNIQNGLPVVQFDGLDDVMDTAAFTCNQPNTVFLVVKFAVDLVYMLPFDSIPAGAFHYLGKATNNKCELYAGVALQVGLLSTSTVLLEATFNGASSQIFKNGTSQGTGDGGTNALTGVRIGEAKNDSAPLDGFLAEVLVYNANVAAGDRTLIRSYLNARWAVY